MHTFRSFMSLAVVAGLVLMVGAGGAEAKTFKVKGTTSGSAVTVPVDILGDSCVVVNNIEVCTATSSLSTYAGKSSGGPGYPFNGAFTGQSIDQTIPVAGVGCALAPDTIAACTIGTNDAGCKYEYVVNAQQVGGAGVNRLTATGDLGSFYITGGSYCVDGTTGAYEGSNTSISSLGTGKAVGFTGTSTTNFKGQIMLFDPAKHGFNWFTTTFNGTATK